MSGFNHSIKVPTQYKRVAAILKIALESRQKSLKTLIYEEKHAVSRNKQYPKATTRVEVKNICFSFSELVACTLY